MNAPAAQASLTVPALALGGFAWTRRWRYASFFLALALAGALIMTSGFPDGTPLRHALTFTYNRVDVVLTTGKRAGLLR